MKKQSLFKLKSPFFVIAILVSILLTFLFGSWIGVKATTTPFAKLYGAMGVDTSSTIGEVKIDETAGQPIKIWKEKDGSIVDDFKILSISDCHFCEEGNDFCLQVLDKYLDMEHPDLVVLDGDNIYKYTGSKFVNELVNFFETRHQYWTLVLGNHDGQGWVENPTDDGYWDARKKAFERESGIEQGLSHQYCLARNLITDPNHPEYYGYGTNRIDIIGSDSFPIQTLFFFDCMTITHENLVVKEWLTQQMTTAANVMAFTHIPFLELDDACKLIGKDESVQYQWGTNLESPCPDGTYNGLFDVFVDNKQKQPLLVFGHDHINNINLKYKGVEMMYTLGLQYNAYNMRWSKKHWIRNIGYVLDNTTCNYIDGVSEYVVHPTYRTIGNKYNQFTGVFKGLEKGLYLATYGNFTYGVEGLTISLQILLPLSAIAVGLYWFNFGQYWYQLKKQPKAKKK